MLERILRVFRRHVEVGPEHEMPPQWPPKAGGSSFAPQGRYEREQGSQRFPQRQRLTVFEATPPTRHKDGDR